MADITPSASVITLMPAGLRTLYERMPRVSREDRKLIETKGVRTTNGYNKYWFSAEHYSMDERLWADLERFVKRAKRLVDIGCGAGEMLMLFHQINPKAELIGIEIEPATAEVASRYLAGVAEVICADARTCSLRGADSVYTWNPSYDSSSFYGEIWANLPRGTRWFELAVHHYSSLLNVLRARRLNYDMRGTVVVKR